MRVTLQCGAKAELLSVEEPSRCTYAATLVTPAACTEGVLEAVRQEIRGITGEGGPVPSSAALGSTAVDGGAPPRDEL